MIFNVSFEEDCLVEKVVRSEFLESYIIEERRQWVEHGLINPNEYQMRLLRIAEQEGVIRNIEIHKPIHTEE